VLKNRTPDRNLSKNVFKPQAVRINKPITILL
jgi:hypothetical protein